MPVVVTFVIPAEKKFVTHVVAGTFAAVRNGTVLLLQFRIEFFVYDCDSASVFHGWLLCPDCRAADRVSGKMGAETG